MNAESMGLAGRSVSAEWVSTSLSVSMFYGPTQDRSDCVCNPDRPARPRVLESGSLGIHRRYNQGQLGVTELEIGRNAHSDVWILDRGISEVGSTVLEERRRSPVP